MSSPNTSSPITSCPNTSSPSMGIPRPASFQVTRNGQPGNQQPRNVQPRGDQLRNGQRGNQQGGEEEPLNDKAGGDLNHEELPGSGAFCSTLVLPQPRELKGSVPHWNDYSQETRNHIPGWDRPSLEAGISSFDRGDSSLNAWGSVPDWNGSSLESGGSQILDGNDSSLATTDPKTRRWNQCGLEFQGPISGWNGSSLERLAAQQAAWAHGQRQGELEPTGRGSEPAAATLPSTALTARSKALDLGRRVGVRAGGGWCQGGGPRIDLNAPSADSHSDVPHLIVAHHTGTGPCHTAAWNSPTAGHQTSAWHRTGECDGGADLMGWCSPQLESAQPPCGMENASAMPRVDTTLRL